MRVREGIETFGGSGTALLSGKFVQLPAYGPVATLDLGGSVGMLRVTGGMVATATVR